MNNTNPDFNCRLDRRVEFTVAVGPEDGREDLLVPCDSQEHADIFLAQISEMIDEPYRQFLVMREITTLTGEWQLMPVDVPAATK